MQSVDIIGALYLSGILTKEDYLIKKQKYENEILQLNECLKTAAGKKHYAYDSCNALTEIREYLSDILYAKKQNEIFYRTIIDKIVVFDREHFDIYLKKLPHSWKILLS